MQAIDGNDIYNSKFIYDLDRVQEIGKITPTLYKGRLDLIAEDLYATLDPIYYEVMAVLNRVFQEDDTTYEDLKCISKTQLRELKLG
jgi:flavodoxin